MNTVATTTTATAAWDWSARGGINYDYISQDYYLQLADTLGLSPDSLEELRRYSDRIDEKGINFRLELRRAGTVDVTVGTNNYVTDEKLRSLLTLKVRWNALQLFSESELKSYGSSGTFSLYDRRLQSSSRLSLYLLENDDWKVELSEEFEYSGYENGSPFVYGYRQYESRLRFQRHLGDFSDLRWILRYDRRDAYDSSQLGFHRFVGEASYDYIGAGSAVRASVYGERRDYEDSDIRYNYYYLTPYLDFDFSLSEKLHLAPRLEAHYYSYDKQRLATFSHLRTLVEVRLKYHYGLLSTFSIGSGGEMFAAATQDYRDQDYSSFKGLVGFETFASRRFSLSVESQLGRRGYRAETAAFYTDHWYLRFDLLGDVKITDRIRLSLVGGSDFEYHESRADDVLVYLLSGSVTYQIK